MIRCEMKVTYYEYEIGKFLEISKFLKTHLKCKKDFWRILGIFNRYLRFKVRKTFRKIIFIHSFSPDKILINLANICKL